MPVLEDEDRGKKIEENEEREKKHERESKTGENNVHHLPSSGHAIDVVHHSGYFNIIISIRSITDL